MRWRIANVLANVNICFPSYAFQLWLLCLLLDNPGSHMSEMLGGIVQVHAWRHGQVGSLPTHTNKQTHTQTQFEYQKQLQQLLWVSPPFHTIVIQGLVDSNMSIISYYINYIPIFHRDISLDIPSFLWVPKSKPRLCQGSMDTCSMV